MTPLDWIPERYPASGGLAAAGFYKLLGRPRLDPLTVLVRETAQNSWDARLPDRQVHYRISCRSPLLPTSRRTLRDVVFPAAAAAGTGLDTALDVGPADGLVISDRGTRGLGGPVSADEVSVENVYDWVDFVLNVGKPNLHGHTGGTYGFGKTITYIVSSVNAAVIHTHTTVGGRPVTRLIACAIGDEFDRDGRLHTGRHWWGRNRDGNPAPETGADADAIAAALGMPGFADDETGTDILLVAPDLAGRTPVQAATFLAESVTWHLWPKLLPHPSRDIPMTVTVDLDGDPVPVPEPADRPPLHGFAQAFSALLDGVPVGRRPDGLERAVIRCERPARVVGDLVTVPLVMRRRADVDDGPVDGSDDDGPGPAAVISGACHHTALLRTPELVVDYLAGAPPPEGGTEWAAIFRCRDDVDEHFAAAEPPTHDSWQPALLAKSHGKTFVKVGLRRVQQLLADRWAPTTGNGNRAPTASTATVADGLASLVRAVPESGAGRQPRAGGPGGPRRTRVELVSTGVTILDGRPTTTARVRVTPRTGATSVQLHVAAAVALDDSGADPTLDPDLRLLRADVDGTVVDLAGPAAFVDVPADRPTEVTVTAVRSDDTAVRFDFTPSEPPAP